MEMLTRDYGKDAADRLFRKLYIICIDTLGGRVVEHRVKVLNQLKEFLQKSPHISELATRRPHTQDKTRKRLSERVTTSRTPSAGGVIRYFIVGWVSAQPRMRQTVGVFKVKNKNFQ